MLDRETIVSVALDVIEDGGIDNLSMRVLARALGAKASSLYHYFPSKETLLEAMADRIVAGVAKDINRSQSRNEVLRELGVSFRAALLRHRDGGRLFAGTFPIGSNVFDLSEVALEGLLASGMPKRDCVDAAFNLFYLVIGSVIEQQAGERQFKNGPDDVRSEFEALALSQFPSVSFCIQEILTSEPRSSFERGLDFYLAGLPLARG